MLNGNEKELKSDIELFKGNREALKGRQRSIQGDIEGLNGDGNVLESDRKASKNNGVKWNEMNRALGHLCAHIG